jgi:hypothetical protein
MPVLTHCFSRTILNSGLRSRLFGAADYGGALFGEVIAIAKNIKSGDYDSWYDANNTFADRLADEAAGQLRKGHKISARCCAFRS